MQPVIVCSLITCSVVFLLDFSFETWQGDTGLTLGDPLPYWAESLLYEQTGLSPYLKKPSSQCSLSSAMFNSTAIDGKGWVNGKYISISLLFKKRMGHW